MATAGRGTSGDAEFGKSVKRTEDRNSSTGWSPGRRGGPVPKGMNKGKASKDPAKPNIRKPIGS